MDFKNKNKNKKAVTQLKPRNNKKNGNKNNMNNKKVDKIFRIIPFK